MNIQTVLYPIHDRNVNENHTPVIDLCRKEDNHLTVVVFAESLPIPLMTAGDPHAAEGWARNVALAEAQLQSHTRDLEEMLNAAGIKAECRAQLGDGIMVDEVIVKHAACADLALMKRRSGSDESGFFKRLCHGVLFQTGKPVLVFTDTPPPDFAFENILIAWDGNRAANRVIAESLPLLKKAKSVHILCVDPDKIFPTRADEPVWDISTYLARHDIPITMETQESNDNSVSQVIQQCATELGADLLVTGAYGHSRLRERIFGGTTRELLDQCDFPLFMVH